MRLIEGGSHFGRDVSASDPSRANLAVELQHAYVVLETRSRVIDGTSYALLSPDPREIPTLYTAEMFEIVSPKVPSSWIAFDPYGNGRVIDFTPRPWTEPPEFMELKGRDPRLQAVFEAEVERMFAEEGMESPFARSEG